MSDVIIYQGAAIPFSFSRQNGQPLDVTSVMRTLADITTYAANTEKKYVPYEGQTIACLEDKMLYILELKNGVLIPKLSGGVKLIKRDDNVELTDDAALSALRSVKEIEERAISRTKRDAAAEPIEFAKGLTAGNGKTTVSGDGKITTLNLLVQALAETYDLNVSHVATMMRTIIKDYVSSETFTPGLTGEGFKISKAINGDWNLEIDNIVVRKVMTIFEMVISKVRSVNGGLVISPANGRIKSVAETTGSPAYYVIDIEGDMQFVVDDYVRCQVFSNGHAKYYWVRVSSISGNSILVLKSEFTNGAVPAIGDDLVQMGNATNKARQGIIYLTASDDGKPRISVMDGVNSTSLVGKNKVILGCLDGITDTDFPADFQPIGYGLYAMNVFLKGIFVLRSGKTVESELTTTNAAVTAAKQIADAAKELANSANTLLSDIASDNKLTPSEKQATKKEWEQIVSEKPLNNASAVKFYVSTAAYDTAYNALNTYITPLLSSLSTTSNIVGSTFRGTFKAYYDARTNLLNAVSEKAKRLADDAQNAANAAQAKADTVTASLQTFLAGGGLFESKITEVKEYADGKVDGVIFGSRNLLINSGVEFGAANYNLGNKMYSPFERKKGKQYTITMCYTLGDNNSNITAYEVNGSYGAASFSTRGSRVIESKTFTPVHPDWGIGSQSMGFYQFPNGQFGSKIHWVTLVEGNKGLSAFTPAPEDVAADTEAARLAAVAAQNKANEAATDAATAQTAANNAASTANAAKSRLDNWSADGSISPTEKLTLKQEQKALLDEKTQIVADAAKYAVSSTAYVTAYTNYNGELTYHTATTPEVIAIRANFATYQAAYYTAKQTILNAISVASKKYAEDKADDAKQAAINDAAGKYPTKSQVTSEIKQKADEINLSVTEKVDGVQVGGRNLLEKSSIEKTGANEYLNYANTNSCFDKFGVGQYVISFDLKLSKAGNVSFYSTPGLDSEFKYVFPSTGISATTEYVRYAVVVNVRISNPNSSYSALAFYATYGTGRIPSVKNVKIEKGNKPTDWTPAPEDVAADAQAKANAAQAAAEAVAIAKATLAKTEASAYADGIVTEEEKRAIADAKAKYDAALLDATRKADAAKAAAINDAANKYPTKTELSSSIEVLNGRINLKVGQSDFNALGQRVGSAESAIVQQATQISAQVTKVNDLTGRVDRAELALSPDNIWLGIKSNVAASIPLYTTQVDTRSLDPNKYYLVTIGMNPSIPYTITVERSLYRAMGVPPWCSHSEGFSVICKWQSNGSAWGGSNVKRVVQTLEYRFAGSCPVGSIGQILESSEEYIYVRGGSIYTVRVEGTSSTRVTLRTSTHTPQPDYPASSRPSPIDSISKPLVDLDQKVTEEQVKTGISITPGTVNVFGKQISLAGAVTFSSMASDAQGKINDAQNAANAAGAAASTAQNTANKAITDAANAQLSATSANAAITNLTNSLGGLAYSDLVGLAKLDTTIIEGGYIKTNLINATAIVTSVLAATNVTATNLTVTGNSNIGGMVIKDGKLTGGSIVLETGARIGGMKVSGIALTNEGFNNDAYIILRNDNKGTFVGIGGDVMPSGVGTRATGRFECEGSQYGLSNTALVLRARGATGFGARNIALDMQGEIITRDSNGVANTGKTFVFRVYDAWIGGQGKVIDFTVTNGLITNWRFE